MRSAKVDMKTALFALFVALGAYGFVLCLLTLHPFTKYDDVVMALAIGALATTCARIELSQRRSESVMAAILVACRGLPLTTRLAGALSLVFVALAFDRYLDGDPEHYRIATFIVPVVVSVILFDLSASALAIAGSAAAVDYLLIKPIYSFQLVSTSDALDLVIYIFICGQIAIAVDRYIKSGALEIASSQS